jgi:acyl carrier protein
MNFPDSELNGRNAIMTRVIDAATGLTQDWERAFAEPIAPETLLVRDLGCQSLDIMVLIGQLSRELERCDVPIERLFHPNGKPASDISLRTVADFLWELTNQPAAHLADARG